MKTILSAHRAAFLAAALATASVTATFADTTTTTSTTPPTTAPVCTAGGKHHHGPALTDAEKAQLKSVRDEAFAADPSLKSEHDSLKQQFAALKSSGTATPDQKKALHEQAHDFFTKLQAAEVKIDPTVAPILAKLDAGKHHWHHAGV
jgi:Spy/CpxP family protein refolding chaperone